MAQLRNVHSVWKLDRNSQADALFSFSLFRSLRANSGRHLCLIYSGGKKFPKKIIAFFLCWNAKNKLANNFSCFSLFLLLPKKKLKNKKKLSTFAYLRRHCGYADIQVYRLLRNSARVIYSVLFFRQQSWTIINESAFIWYKLVSKLFIFLLDCTLKTWKFEI